MGDAGTAPVAGPGDEEQAGRWPARGCLAVVLIGVFIVVVGPALLWAAGILIAGGR